MKKSFGKSLKIFPNLSRLVTGVFLLFAAGADSAEAEPMKVGILAPLTGEMEIFGRKALDGIQLALDNIPQERLTYIVEDVGTGATAEVAKATSKLVSMDKVAVVIGAFYLDQTLVAAPITERANVPLISLTLCSPELKKFKQVACGYPSTQEQLGALGKLVRKLNIKRVALLRENSSYGEDTERVALSVFESEGIEVAAKDSVNGTERDFRTLITKLIRTKPDSVFSVTADPGQSFAFFKQLKEQGYRGHRIGYLDIDPKYLKEFGSTIEGIYLPGFLTTKYSADFTSAFTKRYSRKPDMYSAQSYDLARIVSAAALAKDSASSLFQRVLAERLPQPAVPDYHFRSDGTVSVPVYVLVIRNGQYVLSEFSGDE